MKKKVLLIVLCLMTCFLFTACRNTTTSLVKQNMSELTEIYFYGECEEFYCSISSGEREKNYLMDGKSGECVDYALVAFSPVESRAEKILKLTLKIGGVENEIEVEINSLKSNYLFDLEKKLSGEEKVSIVFEGKEIDLKAISKDFNIDCNKALEIASIELEDKILLKKKFGNLNAEGYLRVLDKKANNFDEMFWCYTVLNIDNESYSIVISTDTGEVLAKS